MFRARHYYPLALLCLLWACNPGPKREPAIGEAYVGPATVTLRQELGIRSTPVASVTHGERLEIVGTRRRFVKVRTAKGIEGWTDSRLLLSPSQMEEIRRFSQQSSNLPSQGSATVYTSLNVHVKPDRLSPWFMQVKEKQEVQVLARTLAPRNTSEPKSELTLPAPKHVHRKPPPKPSSRIPPPPLPKPPKPPADWVQLSASVAPLPKVEEAPKPVPLDDWTLVRTSDGRVGWVLSRMLVMSIPDEVAQYSEGRRITAYFSLGTVQDGDKIRHHWVWTTLSDSLAPYDFDSFRVFIWSLRHHRFETAYIERNLKGYYPVEAMKVQTQYNKKPITAQGFAVITEGADGVLYRRTFALIGNLIFPAGKTRYVAPPETGGIESAAASRQHAAAPPRPPSFYAWARQIVKGWFGR